MLSWLWLFVINVIESVKLTFLVFFISIDFPILLKINKLTDFIVIDELGLTSNKLTITIILTLIVIVITVDIAIRVCLIKKW